ncbi:hypothetical protein QTG54_003745 [Skeletonema marinoi]|uniref:Uncharacterized protein n=1 Tax=Skeletonema marinoi TaxID=267567 RepID=A0AAD8YG16_9STRA|nr:hypothetical protein QTG54_003745 [Skeletonema marinoi]
MEDPFGHDESDLPLEKFCEEIDKQITAVDERAKIITFDLATGPAAHVPSERTSSYSTFPSSTSSSSRGRMPSSYRESPATSGDDDIESGLMSETVRLVT